MNDEEYKQNERKRFLKQLADVEAGTLAERKEGQADWLEAMKDTKTVARNVDWILNGSYGQGVYFMAHEIRLNKRMNRAAIIGQWLAAMEYDCPAAMARKAYNQLTKDEQKNINAAIINKLDSYKEDK